jgi:hypothetical protein
MKKITIGGILVTCLFALLCLTSRSQVTYQYLLKQDFHGVQSAAPDLEQVPNNQSETGEFVIRPVPASTCGEQGNAPGYHFADDAGLMFHNPAGFIGQEYTIAFNFQFDEFISPPGWVRVMSFTHYDDVGIYIKLTGAPTTGTLEFWPYGQVGTADFFTTVDFYQMILVRNAAGMITVYVNGSEFAQYDDSGTQAYVPQDPDNFVIWFRDDPSVLAGEASPGFVSDIRIGNFSWTSDQVQGAWAAFCSSLLAVGSIPDLRETRIHPNPAESMVALDLEDNVGTVEATILDVTGRIMQRQSCAGRFTADVSALKPGMYVIVITGQNYQKAYRFVKK